MNTVQFRELRISFAITQQSRERITRVSDTLTGPTLTLWRRNFL